MPQWPRITKPGPVYHILNGRVMQQGDFQAGPGLQCIRERAGGVIGLGGRTAAAGAMPDADSRTSMRVAQGLNWKSQNLIDVCCVALCA